MVGLVTAKTNTSMMENMAPNYMWCGTMFKATQIRELSVLRVLTVPLDVGLGHMSTYPMYVREVTHFPHGV